MLTPGGRVSVGADLGGREEMEALPARRAVCPLALSHLEIMEGAREGEKDRWL